MAEVWNDNTVQYGSIVLAISADGTTGTVDYVADNVTVNRPTKIIKRTDQLDEPSGSVGVADFVEGSAQLQLETGSTDYPTAGHWFINTFSTTIGSETFIIHSVGNPLTKDGETKVPISFIKKYS